MQRSTTRCLRPIDKDRLAKLDRFDARANRAHNYETRAPIFSRAGYESANLIACLRKHSPTFLIFKSQRAKINGSS